MSDKDRKRKKKEYMRKYYSKRKNLLNYLTNQVEELENVVSINIFLNISKVENKRRVSLFNIKK